jgi:hypothetical protein
MSQRFATRQLPEPLWRLGQRLRHWIRPTSVTLFTREETQAPGPRSPAERARADEAQAVLDAYRAARKDFIRLLVREGNSDRAIVNAVVGGVKHELQFARFDARLDERD